MRKPRLSPGPVRGEPTPHLHPPRPPCQVAAALSLSPPRVVVREVRGGAFVVFDLLPAAAAASTAAGGAARADVAAVAAAQAAADVLALEVVELLLAEGGAFYPKGAAAGSIDPRYGLLVLRADGRTSQLLRPDQLQQAQQSPSPSAP